MLWTARCSILEQERVNLWKNIPFGENWRCNGLPVALPHDAMLSERRTQESVSEKLGHSDKAVTLRMYTHANEESIKRASQIFREALKNQA